MTANLDRFVRRLQQEFDDQARARYSPKVIEEYSNPGNMVRMTEPDVHGLVHGWCGDTMEVFLRLDGEMIEEATFVTDGCGPTTACGSVLTKTVRGMSLVQAGEIRPKDLLVALDGLPEESVHCAELAVSTLQNAIFNLRASTGAPEERQVED